MIPQANIARAAMARATYVRHSHADFWRFPDGSVMDEEMVRAWDSEDDMWSDLGEEASDRADRNRMGDND